MPRRILLCMTSISALLHVAGCGRSDRVEELRREVAIAQARQQALLDKMEEIKSRNAPADPPTGTAEREILERLERSTALVLMAQDDGSLGSGFFVAPQLLLTTRHTIEGASDGKVRLVSRMLGGAREGRVERRSSDLAIDGIDLALVRLEQGEAPGVLPLADEIGKLDAVIAAGYPSVVVKRDPGYKRLIAGDLRAAPDLNVTRGYVRSLQEGHQGASLVLHTAEISQGNSGGPLLDRCGRVVGLNTFIAVSSQQATRASYALRSRDLIAFIEAAGYTLQVDRTDCR